MLAKDPGKGVVVFGWAITSEHHLVDV